MLPDRIVGGSPPPKFSTFLRSLAPALWRRWVFREVRMHVLFIGHGRSGSSLVGSLLNAHRHSLIAHELNTLLFVKRHFTRPQVNWLLWAQDQAFGRAGREWTGYDYRVAGQWQGRFKRLLVIGDKHAGGTTRVLAQRPEMLDRLRWIAGVPVKMVHVVRRPLDNIATLHRRQNLTLPAAADHYFKQSATNQRLLRENPHDTLTMYLEDVIARPSSELSRLCNFLDLDAPVDYLAACSASVFPEPRRTRDSVVWPPGLTSNILDRCQPFEFLHRYADDLTGTRSANSRGA